MVFFAKKSAIPHPSIPDNPANRAMLYGFIIGVYQKDLKGPEAIIHSDLSTKKASVHLFENC